MLQNADMWTLVLNCGSSSVKFAVLNPGTGEQAFSGLAERLGSPGARVVITRGGQRTETATPNAEYAGAFGALLSELDHLDLTPQVQVVGHRVVHGGHLFSAPALIDEAVLEGVRACIPLAPLHNPANLAGIEAAQRAFPELPQVAVFDTAFHQSMPPLAYRYAVPEAWYTRHGVRRYGFHGTSHAYVAQEAARLLGRPLETLNLITAHLGNGCSVAALAGGKSVDTSMGLTPLEGLVMGTRSGDVDPNLHDYLARQAGLSLEQVTAALNRQSGLLGLSGLGSDMRELEQAAADGHEGARLANRGLRLPPGQEHCRYDGGPAHPGRAGVHRRHRGKQRRRAGGGDQPSASAGLRAGRGGQRGGSARTERIHRHAGKYPGPGDRHQRGADDRA